jgi:dTDP-4-dehydrorhamnose reductase
MNIFLTGGSGLLGKALIEEASKNTHIIALVRSINSEVLASNVEQIVVDFYNDVELDNLFMIHNPEVLIHAAAEGRVDAVEADHTLGRTVNVDLTEKLAKACARNSVHMIFISSNAVFGDQKTPFNEADTPKPLNVYGRLKLEAEKIVQNVLPTSLILRPILLYGWPYDGSRDNPAKNWIDTLRKKEKISVVDDVYSQPLSAYDCARLIWKVSDSKTSGILHVSGLEHITLYEFACEVANVFGLDKQLINKAKILDFPSLAPRPVDTMYSHLKLIDVGFTPKTLFEGLKEMKSREKASE